MSILNGSYGVGVRMIVQSRIILVFSPTRGSMKAERCSVFPCSAKLPTASLRRRHDDANSVISSGERLSGLGKDSMTD